jgi:hypothetical protein
MTQAEIGFFVLLAGGRSEALFLAGDTAQAVAHGVDFRFEEVRSVVHAISDGKQVVAKPTRLYRNFRSHEGVLRVAKLVLDQLHAVFPFAAAKMQADTGMMPGPKPILAHASLGVVKTMLRNNPMLKVLVRDESRAELLSNGVAQRAVFELREAKGLEFGDVLILNFFGGSKWQKSWKTLFGSAIDVNERTLEGVRATMPGEMELELKLLYVGITRACHRLFFIETEEVQCSKAWFRCLHDRALSSEVDEETLVKFATKGVMTEGEWLAEGIDLATFAQDRAGEEAARLWENAIESFRQSGEMGEPHLQRAQAQLNFSEIQALSGTATEANAAAAVKACLATGLIQEAAKICDLHSSNARVEKLGGRIRRLRNGTPAAAGVDIRK